MASLSFIGCSEPPVVSVSLEVADGAPDVSDLVRYRMIVRRCTDEFLAYTLDLDPQDPNASSADTPIPPGEPFYVWVQGWGACPSNSCAPDDTASDDDCRCFGELQPTFQRMTVEACTDWLVTSNDEEISIRLDHPTAGCPPPRPDDCDTLEP